MRKIYGTFFHWHWIGHETFSETSEWKIAPSSEDYDTDFDPDTSTDHVQFDPETSVINIRLSLLKDLPTNESSLDFYVISALYSGGKWVLFHRMFCHYIGGRVKQTVTHINSKIIRQNMKLLMNQRMLPKCKLTSQLVGTEETPRSSTR